MQPEILRKDLTMIDIADFLKSNLMSVKTWGAVATWEGNMPTPAQIDKMKPLYWIKSSEQFSQTLNQLIADDTIDEKSINVRIGNLYEETTVLSLAIKHGESEDVKKLLQLGADISTFGEYIYPAMIYCQSSEILRMLLEQHPQPWSETALVAAIYSSIYFYSSDATPNKEEAQLCIKLLEDKANTLPISQKYSYQYFQQNLGDRYSILIRLPNFIEAVIAGVFEIDLIREYLDQHLAIDFDYSDNPVESADFLEMNLEMALENLLYPGTLLKLEHHLLTLNDLSHCYKLELDSQEAPEFSPHISEAIALNIFFEPRMIFLLHPSKKELTQKILLKYEKNFGVSIWQITTETSCTEDNILLAGQFIRSNGQTINQEKLINCLKLFHEIDSLRKKSGGNSSAINALLAKLKTSITAPKGHQHLLSTSISSTYGNSSVFAQQNARWSTPEENPGSNLTSSQDSKAYLLPHPDI